MAALKQRRPVGWQPFAGMAWLLLMIVMFTDFGRDGPYVGQMEAVLACAAPDVPRISLMHDAPVCNPRLSAYLLAALLDHVPCGVTVLAVVDPGVGSRRRGLVIHTQSHVLVGPDNGLLAIAARRQGPASWYAIDWVPENLSASFHGRDWFAPVAARLATGKEVSLCPCAPGIGVDWPDVCHEVIYVDHFGNLMTGIWRNELSKDQLLSVGDRIIAHARTFAEVPEGGLFWYENSQGLIEIAANRGRAAECLNAGVGTKVSIVEDGL